MSEIYPPPSPPGWRPERTLPIGSSRPLKSEEHQITNGYIAEANSLPIKQPSEFTYVAAFDGTRNKRGDLELSGNPSDTGISILEDLVRIQNLDNVASIYKAGVGTKGFISKYIAASILPTGEVYAQAAEAYDELVEKSNTWPRESGGDIDLNIATIGFSRGGAAAIIFAKILNEHGIPDTSTAYTVEVPSSSDGVLKKEFRYTKHLKPPGVKLNALLVDPVATGIYGDLTRPPNIERLHSDYVANDHRSTFAPMEFSNPRNPDPGVTEKIWPGAHSSLMNGYDKNGLGAAYLIHGRRMLMSMGVPVAPIADEYKYLPETAQIHDSAVGPCLDHWVPTRSRVPYWDKSFDDVPGQTSSSAPQGPPLGEAENHVSSGAVDNHPSLLGRNTAGLVAAIPADQSQDPDGTASDNATKNDSAPVNAHGLESVDQEQPPVETLTPSYEVQTPDAQSPRAEVAFNEPEAPMQSSEVSPPLPASPSPAELAGRDALAATNAFNTFLSTFNGWSQMNDLQRAGSVIQLANGLSSLTAGQITVPVALTGAASAINVFTALESGNYGSALAGCLQLADSLTPRVRH